MTDNRTQHIVDPRSHQEENRVDQLIDAPAVQTTAAQLPVRGAAAQDPAAAVAHVLRWGNDVFEATFATAPDAPVGFLAVVGRGMAAADQAPAPTPYPIVDVLLPQFGRRPGSHRTGETENGARLRLQSTRTSQADDAEVLHVVQRDELTGMLVTSVFKAWPGVSGFQTWTEIEAGATEILVEAVTTFSIGVFPTQIGRTVEDLDVFWGYCNWATENVWQRQDLRSTGLTDVGLDLNPHIPRNRFAVTSLSSWSSGERLPVGVLTTKDDAFSIAWQIEHSGGWSWEIAEDMPGAHVTGTGPTEAAHQWNVTLAPGERFVAVPASVVVVAGDYQQAIGELTLQRRALRSTDEPLPVIYNDYMNTLFGDPTAEKESPLIAAAGAIGADYFCIDAGWYADMLNSWWDSVGEWQPSPDRFPAGLGAVIGEITDAGMVPGLWLEPEVIGIDSPLAASLPDDAFFSRNGVRVRESGRYHLDLRSEAARGHLDETVDRLVADFGVGFFKLDYNIMAGGGTDLRDRSVGAGLLGHNRAYLDWLDSIQARHPGLLIENCASGAMRADYSLLSRLHMQSTSDQCDPLKYAVIAAAAPMTVLPEQAGNWGYAQQEMTQERAVLTLAAGVLGRLYLSGFVDLMDDDRRDLVRQAIAVHRRVLSVMERTVPFWPLGLPGWDDGWLATGLRPAPGDTGAQWMTVWRRSGDATAVLDLGALAGTSIDVEQVFPLDTGGWEVTWSQETGQLTVHTDVVEPSARIFAVTPRLD